MKNLVYIFIFYIASNTFGQSTLSVTLTKINKTCLLGTAAISINAGVSPYKIKWSTGDSDKVSINQLDISDYSVIVKDNSGKDTTIYFSIEDETCPVGISNHFTPNDDDYNDRWYIDNINHYPNFELFVFNRAGQMVYHQTERYIPWDGKWLGIDVPDATYYYIFYFDKSDKANFKKGDITILR